MLVNIFPLTYEAVIELEAQLAVPNKLPVSDPDALNANDAVPTFIELVLVVNTYGCSIDEVVLVKT